MTTNASLTPYENNGLFTKHYLNTHLQETEPWQTVDDDDVEEAYEEVDELHDQNVSALENANEDQVQDMFINPVLDALGVVYAREGTIDGTSGDQPDYAFFKNEAVKREAIRMQDESDVYDAAIAVAEAKDWGHPLDGPSNNGEPDPDPDLDDKNRDNPSAQINRYLRDTGVEWGVLTNGIEWRLYYAGDGVKVDRWYQINLQTILSDTRFGVEEFKQFYMLYRGQSFDPSTGVSGCYLTRIYDGSNAFARELGDDLEDNIYEAIQILADGFLNTPRATEFDTDDLTDEQKELVFESSLTYLYRLIFVLYAESDERHLLPRENTTYRNEYGLVDFKQEVKNNIQDTNHSYDDKNPRLWNRLELLFQLIDRGSEHLGYDEDELYIPAYDGGLFNTNPDPEDSETDHFLANARLGNEYIAKAIYRVSYQQDADQQNSFFDYSRLSIRNIGSIYEGLLEHHLEVGDEPLTTVNDDGSEVWATEEEYFEEYDEDPPFEAEVEEDEVYLRTDNNERRATGSYYTPQKVVNYIVSNSLDPLINEIKSDLGQIEEFDYSDDETYTERFMNRILDLRVIDPAMGSGHFLRDAVEYLVTEIETVADEERRILEEQDDPPIDPPESLGLNYTRRRVTQECIYGIDVNEMAVELAKMSLWLHTLANDQPLAFLDHHFKAGNSVIGSEIGDVKNAYIDQSSEQEGHVSTRLTYYDSTLTDIVGELLERYSDFIGIDLETREAAEEIKRKYRDFQNLPQRCHFQELLNVFTADRLDDISVDPSDYEEMADVLSDPEQGDEEWEVFRGKDWFQHAQDVAEKESFFHWELEFPEIYYDPELESDGDDIDYSDVEKDNPGFDAVIGNPPYVSIQNIDEYYRNYYEKAYADTYQYRYDLYAVFVDQGLDATRNNGRFSYIIPHTLLNNQSFENTRRKLLDESDYVRIIDFTDDVFEDATNEPMILYAEPNRNREEDDKQTLESTTIHPDDLPNANDSLREFPSEVVEYLPWNPLLIRPAEWVEDYLETDRTAKLGNIADTQQGLRTGNNSEFLTESPPDDGNVYRKILRGDDLHRYGYVWGGEYVLYDRDALDAPRDEKYWEADKRIIANAIRNSQMEDRIVSTIDLNEYIGFNSTITILPRSENEESIYYLLAIVTSGLTDHYFWTCFIDNNLASEYYDSIPIPIVDFDTSEDEREQVVEDLEEKVEAFLDGDIDSDTISDFADGHILHEPEDETSDDEEEGEESADGESEELERRVIRDIAHDMLVYLAKEHTRIIGQRDELNTNLVDFIQPYIKGECVDDLGQIQPTSESRGTVLPETTNETEKGSPKINGIRCSEPEKVAPDTYSVTVKVRPKYKPQYPEKHETDRHGYIVEDEQEYIPALRFTNLDEENAILLSEFLPQAYENSDLRNQSGLKRDANTRDSMIDRVKDIKLPDTSQSHVDMETFIENKRTEKEYNTQSEKIDDVTNHIVARLYGNPLD
jgi:hypothetical protein